MRWPYRRTSRRARTQPYHAATRPSGLHLCAANGPRCGALWASAYGPSAARSVCARRASLRKRARRPKQSARIARILATSHLNSSFCISTGLFLLWQMMTGWALRNLFASATTLSLHWNQGRPRAPAVFTYRQGRGPFHGEERLRDELSLGGSGGSEKRPPGRAEVSVSPRRFRSFFTSHKFRNAHATSPVHGRGCDDAA